MMHSIKNDYMKVTVSEMGAELQSIIGVDGTEYLWQGDPAYWDGRSPNIFPYVARLTQESYYMDGELHHMPIHGFAPTSRFEVVDKSEEEICLELKSTPETYAQYPRKFVFQVEYVLDDDRLDVIYRVKNEDEKPMYFGLGGHPGFNVPLAEGLDFTDYRLKFAAQCNPQLIGLTETCFLNGHDTADEMKDNCEIPLSHELFDNDAIVLKNVVGEVRLESDLDPHSVTVTFPQMSYLGFWHMPKTDAPYVCIEPWCSLPSTQDKIAVFEEQPDLIHLAPGGVYSNVWGIYIE